MLCAIIRWPSTLFLETVVFSFSRIAVFGLLGRYLRQIALIFYVEELSERSRKLDTNVLYLALGDRFREDPDDDASMQRRLFQLDTLSQTHRLEKFVQGQFDPDSGIWRLEKVCKLRWKLCRKITRFTAD